MSRPDPRPAPAALLEAVVALEQALRPGQVRVDEQTREAYSKDESDTGEFLPDVVVLAESTADVSQVLRICQRLAVPVTPCAARSGKSGGSLPLFGGVALSVERMNRIKSISAEDLVAVVEPEPLSSTRGERA